MLGWSYFSWHIKEGRPGLSFCFAHSERNRFFAATDQDPLSFQIHFLMFIDIFKSFSLTFSFLVVSHRRCSCSHRQSLYAWRWGIDQFDIWCERFHLFGLQTVLDCIRGRGKHSNGDFFTSVVGDIEAWGFVALASVVMKLSYRLARVCSWSTVDVGGWIFVSFFYVFC